MTEITDLDPADIREVVDGIEPMVWMKDDRVVCVSGFRLLIRTFCELHSIPITRRFDSWAALCEPYLDTELSKEETQALLATLKDSGFEEAEVEQIRKRISRGLYAATFLSWEWQYYGLGDVRRHCKRIFERLRDGGESFERWTSEIASRPWKREVSAGKPTTIVPAYTPPRYGLKARMGYFPNLIPPNRKRPFFEDFNARYKGEESIVATATKTFSDPSRHYHTLRHLEEALELGGESHRRLRNIRFLSEWEKSREYRDVWWAILFHDSIYRTGRSDNEQLSAELAVETMRRHGLAETECRKVSDLILWTRRHDCAEVSSSELKAMHDGDLGIFGLWPARYADYCEGVRKEWIDSGIVTEPLFNKGRLVFLEKVVEQHRGKPFYFGLDPLFSKLAEENLRGEIEALRKLVG